MKKSNLFKYISVFTFVFVIALFATIIATSMPIVLADSSNSISYDGKDYTYNDSNYFDTDDNTKTFVRKFIINPNDSNAYVSSALQMPKGRYAKMSIKYDLVKLMLDNAFSQSSFGLDKYESKGDMNVLFSQEEYYVKGYDFLSQLDGYCFKTTTSDDPLGNYATGDLYNDDNKSDTYSLKTYIESRLSKYAIDNLSSSYSVESELKFAKYYTIKSEYEGSVKAEENSIKVVILIDFSSIELKPVEDGDIFTASGQYIYTNDLSKDSIVNLSHVTFSVNEEAVDVKNGGYNVELDNSTKLPIGSQLKYIINDNMIVDTSNNYIMLSSFPEEAYTVQGVLTFTTNDLQQVTLKSNILTIQNHTFDIRTNNLYSTNVKVNEEYSYILSADRGKTQISSYLDAKYTWLFNYDKNDDTKAIKNELQIPSFKYTEEGEKYVCVEFDGYVNKYEHIIFLGVYKQEVSLNPSREKPVYNITFNVSNDSTLVVGGDMVTINAAINQIYGDENFKLSYYISAGSCADNISTDPSKLIINPTSSGKIVIGCKATSDIVDTVSDTISLNVVNPKSDKVELISDESFHQNGKDLIVKLSIGGITEFLNYKPAWTVNIEAGENKKAVEFITNEKGYAVVKQAGEGYYLFSVKDSVLSSDETTFRVAKVDMQKIAKRYLPICAVVMIIVIIFASLLKKKVLIGKTVAKQLNKIEAIIDKRINSQEYTIKQFIKDSSSMLFKINHAINIAEELDQKSFGQHQPIINDLKKMKKIISASLTKKDSMTSEKLILVLTNLKTKYVEPTIKLSNDINKVMEKFENERINNIMVVDPDADGKNKN